MKFKLGCEIGYDVFDAATLIFNIEAMRGGRQTILSESLQISPQLDEDEITAIDTGNRYLRLTAAQGALQGRALLGGHHPEHQVHALDPRHPRDRLGHVTPDGVLEGTAGHGEQHDGEVDEAALLPEDREHGPPGARPRRRRYVASVVERAADHGCAAVSAGVFPFAPGPVVTFTLSSTP